MVTKRNDKGCLDRFYSRLHTPVQATLEADAEAVEHAARNPAMYEPRKLLPGSNWEILKPGWIDVLGFGGSWLLVVGILLLLWLLATVGS